MSVLTALFYLNTTVVNYLNNTQCNALLTTINEYNVGDFYNVLKTEYEKNCTELVTCEKFNYSFIIWGLFTSMSLFTLFLYEKKSKTE